LAKGLDIIDMNTWVVVRVAPVEVRIVERVAPVVVRVARQKGWTQ
jgi:hypothetical protein